MVHLIRTGARRVPGLPALSFVLLLGGLLAVSPGVLLSQAPPAAPGAAPTAGQQPTQPPPNPAPGSQPPATPPAGTPPATPPADPNAPAQEQPVFRTGISFVRVDVIVTDKQGRPVTDLTKADFEITEDGKPQQVETFKLVHLTGNPPEGETARAIRSDYDEESEAQREDVRVFVIVLDDYHVRRGSAMVVREPLINFIRTQLGPLDLLGVMYPLTPVTDVRLTRDHDAVIRVIEKFEGRKFDYRPRNDFEERYSMYPAEVVERVRNQVSLSAVEGLAVRLGGLREGRKAIILVSEGYSNYLPPQKRDPVAEMPGLGNPAARRPGFGDGSLAEERYQFMSSLDLQTEMREVYNAANRANTAIYSLDPRGLAPFEYDIDEGVGQNIDRSVLQATTDTLRLLADETDGRAIVNRNDLEGGLRQVVRDSSAYYLVGYNSTLAPSDGKFHAIKVRVRRPGMQVRARKGYWALTAEETAKVLAPPKPGPAPEVSKALASVESPSRAQVVRTWIGMSAAENGRTRVSIVWEPVTRVPGEKRPEPARVAISATGAEGSSYFRGKVPGDGGAPSPEGAPAATTATRAGGRASFEAPPGDLQLRLSIEDAEGHVLDSDMMEMKVPDFTAPEVSLSTLEVHRVRTAREFNALNAETDPTPVATREFRRTERLIVRFQASGPGQTPPTMEARLLNRAGQSMVTLPVSGVPNAAGRSQVDLPLSSLPSGEYLVEVKASGSGGETKQLLGFRVIS